MDSSRTPDHAPNLLAGLAIFLWSFLAYFGARFAHLPSLAVVGAALCISGGISLARCREWRVSPATLAVGIGGIFGYHWLYFLAFGRAPAIEVNLINYLWPLLIVLLSPLILPGFKLHARHLVGALMGLFGAFLIIGGGRLQLDIRHLSGYLLAAGAATIWALYSLLTRRLPPFPNGAVGAFCLYSGILALAAFAVSGAPLDLESLSGADWLALIGMGLGPMGLAFFAWDAALKRGDPRMIGSLAYLTPLLSTLNLAVLGDRQLTITTAAAMALIVGGAVIGTFTPMRRPNHRTGSGASTL